MSNDVAKSTILISCMSYPKWWSSKTRFFCYCSRPFTTKNNRCSNSKCVFVRTWISKIGTWFSFVHMLEFKRIVVECVYHFFCTDFLVNESSSYGVTLICFWTFQMVKITILEEVRVLHLVVISAKKEKKSHIMHTSNTLHTRPRLSTEYTVHE